MKKFSCLLTMAFCFTSILAQPAKEYPIHSAALKNVQVTDGFWFDRITTNREATISHVINECLETGRLDNLEFAAGIKQGEFCSAYQFDDSDIYKTIEAASYSLTQFPDKELDAKLDNWIAIIAKAQDSDGYLYSPRSAPSEKIKNAIGVERWSNLRWSHELYVLGHLYEAAVAHYQATGKKNLLNIALKSAGLLLKDFGPDSSQLHIPPGHEEVELGLVKLYQVTGDEKYLNLAKYFLDIRGKGKELTGRESWGEYAQDHKPVIEQDEAVGHAVRAAYLYSAMTDIAALTGDKKYENAVNKLWQNLTYKKLYVTGGIGSTGSGEALGADYDLPNASAYNETCSSIANMMWNFKMFELYGNGKYLDVFERTLYNAFLSGIGMDGKSFFYPNPLQSYGTHGRSPWFTCACCPPNVARFIASLPSRIYSVEGNNLFVNLYASSKAALIVDDLNVKVTQTTDYPWNGNIKLIIEPALPGYNFNIKLRIPGWAVNKPVDGDLYTFTDKSDMPIVKVNGSEIECIIENGFISINKKWVSGDNIELLLPMDIHRIKANQNADADKDRVALQRGPVVFCAEWVDNPDSTVRNILLPDDAALSAEFKPDMLNGVEIIKGSSLGYKYTSNGTPEKTKQNFFAVPYYAWAHRGSGEMSVWLADNEKAVSPLHGPTLASLSVVTSSSGKDLKAVNDQIEPKSSNDESVPFFHWWPNKGAKEWVQFDFPKLSEVSQVQIYWFDDTEVGECRVPQKWNILYKDGDSWQNVYSTDKYETSKDKFNSVTFETVRTNSLRIEMESQKDFAGGIQEIIIK